MSKERYGRYGGQYVNKMLMPVLLELEETWERHYPTISFQKELNRLLRDYAGRPTPLYHAANLSAEIGCKVYLKREDLVCGESHKPNNTLSQALLTPINTGKGILKDAVSDTLREWSRCRSTTHYLMGSTVGPHPFPSVSQSSRAS